MTEGLPEYAPAIFDVERRWSGRGDKERAIRRLLGISSTLYHTLLNRLLDMPAAYEYDPRLVARLRRLRDGRRAVRMRRRTQPFVAHPAPRQRGGAR